jgi:hypothetical protein
MSAASKIAASTTRKSTFYLYSIRSVFFSILFLLLTSAPFFFYRYSVPYKPDSFNLLKKESTVMPDNKDRSHQSGSDKQQTKPAEVPQRPPTQDTIESEYKPAKPRVLNEGDSSKAD